MHPEEPVVARRGPTKAAAPTPRRRRRAQVMPDVPISVIREEFEHVSTSFSIEDAISKRGSGLGTLLPLTPLLPLISLLLPLASLLLPLTSLLLTLTSLLPPSYCPLQATPATTAGRSRARGCRASSSASRSWASR